MPSSPKIKKEDMLQAALELVSKNGYAANVYQKMAELLGITLKEVMDFAMTMMVYTQGIGTLIASGIVKDTKENMYRMLHNTGMIYLKGLGVKDSTLWDLSECKGSYSGLSIHCQTLRRRADCNITVLHCVIFIMEVR